MGEPENIFFNYFYENYKGRVAIGVGYSQSFEEVFPIVIDDGRGNVLGIVAMAVMVHDDFSSVHIYHFSVFRQKLRNGTKMLEILCRKADMLNAVLSLTPIPSSNGDDISIGSEKLTAWYRQFGFEGDALLSRQPQKSCAITHR